VLLASNFTTFSVSQKLVIDAYLTSTLNIPIEATWFMIDDTNNKINSNFTQYYSTNILSDSTYTFLNGLEKIYFPIVFAPNTFIPRKTYTFQLSIQGVDDIFLYAPVYSRITLTGIAAPASGIITCKPSQGFEFNTSFNIGTSNWAIDSSAFPISYSFFYEVTGTSGRLTLRGKSEHSFLSTQLPYIGDDAIQLVAVVTDKFGSSAEAYTSVLVSPYISASFNLDDLVKSGITDNLKIGNIDAALQSINNIAINMNKINCSSISSNYCVSLNRYNCSTYPNTCGSCLPGYTGVIYNNKICLFLFLNQFII
jgi:hypothetical protein